MSPPATINASTRDGICWLRTTPTGSNRLLEPIQRNLAALGLPPRTIEVEQGPSQVELTFPPSDGIELADQAVLIRAAIKQIARRHSLHATFMSRPAGDDTFTAGWHLHQSVLSAGRRP